MRRPVHRDGPAATEARPLRAGDVVRDPHFPTCLSVFSHVQHDADGTKLVFSQGDNFCFVACVKHGLEHADGAPIDLEGLT